MNSIGFDWILNTLRSAIIDIDDQPMANFKNNILACSGAGTVLMAKLLMKWAKLLVRQ